MGTYATKVEMLKRYTDRQLTELTDRSEPRRNVIEDDILDTAMAGANSEVDAALLAAGYTLPLESVPVFLIDAACDIARMRLAPNAPMGDENPYVARYRAAQAILQAVAQGQRVIATAPVETAAPGLAAGSRTIEFGPAFEQKYGS